MMGARAVFSRRRLLAGTGGAAAAVALAPAYAGAAQPEPGWVGTWAAAADGIPGDGLPNFSIRSALHGSIGGDAVRVRLSNAFGTVPLDMGHVTVALAATPR